MFFLVCSFIYMGIFLCIKKFMSLVHTIKKDKQFSIKILLCICNCIKNHPVNWKSTSKSCKTVLKTIFHASLLDPITLGYDWLQTRFCSWCISTTISFDSVAQLRKLCQSSKKPGCSFYGPAPIFLNCIKLVCNFIKWAVSVISSYKHPAAFQILKKSGLPTTPPECEYLGCLYILPINKSIWHTKITCKKETYLRQTFVQYSWEKLQSQLWHAWRGLFQSLC